MLSLHSSFVGERISKANIENAITIVNVFNGFGAGCQGIAEFSRWLSFVRRARVDMRLLEASLTGFLVNETAPPFRALLNSSSLGGDARSVAF